jgi:hypothetical protein
LEWKYVGALAAGARQHTRIHHCLLITSQCTTINARSLYIPAFHSAGAIGGMLGSVYATNMGSLRPMGMDGWRIAFLTVAAGEANRGRRVWGAASTYDCNF